MRPRGTAAHSWEALTYGLMARCEKLDVGLGWRGGLLSALLPSFLPPSPHALALTEPLPCPLVWGRVQGTNASECEGPSREACRPELAGPVVVSAFSLGLPQLTSQSVTSPSTVPFRVLEPGGIQCLQPERGHHPGEGGVRWPLLRDPPGCRVPHGKGKVRGGAALGAWGLHPQRTVLA